MKEEVDQLDRLDRATLRAWRVSNVVGWCSCSLVAALGVFWLAEALLQSRLYWRVGFRDLVNPLPVASGGGRQLVALVLVVAVMGLVIGWILGHRSAWRPSILAAAVAVMTATAITLLYWPRDSLLGPFPQAMTLWFATPVAWWTALQVGKRRTAGRP